jgi:replicative DNA helicase
MSEYINLEIERKVLKCLYWKKDIFIQSVSRGQLPDKIFSDKSFRLLMKWMKNHFSKTGELITSEIVESKIDKLKLKGKDEKETEVYKDKLFSVTEKFLFKKPLKKDVRNFKVYLEELSLLLKARDLQRYTMDLFKYLDNSDVESALDLASAYNVPSYGDDVDQAEMMENFQERENYVLERKNNPDKYKLVPTGIPELDEALGGGIDREFAGVSGSSNAGKSFFLQSIAAYARKMGFNVVLFTIEMQLLETQFRIDCNFADIDHSFFRNPVDFYDEKIHKKWKTRLQKLAKKKGKLECVAFKKNAKMSSIESKLYEIMNKWQEPIHLCVIDYLDDIEPDKAGVEYKDWKSFGDISWAMHNLAKSFQQIDNTQGLPTWTAMQGKKSGKDAATNAKYFDDKESGSKRVLDERDVGSSPLPFRHADLWLGIQTVFEGQVSLLHMMKGRFINKGLPLIECFHAFNKGRFFSSVMKKKFYDEHIEEKKELGELGLDNVEEIEIPKE